MMDDTAQRLYIETMLGNPGLFARVQHLMKPSYFDDHLQEGVRFMQDFYQKQRGVPSIPVFKASTKLDLNALELPKQDVQFVTEQIAEFCQTRAIIEAVLAAPALIESKQIGKMVNEIKLASQVQLHTDLGIDYFADPIARLEDPNNEQELIPFGLKDLDDLVGGIGREEIVVYTANSGIGKSAIMLNDAFRFLKRGMNGVYISLEMKDANVARRLDAMISKISTKNISVNKLKVGQDIEIARESGYGRFFIKRMREGTTNANHIISYLRELEAVHGFKPDFVVVDYLDICASVQKHDGSNMFTKDKLVTEEIRAIGFDFKCIMISASQLGRGAIAQSREDKALGQDHIQGGISKINTADLVIAIVKTAELEALGQYRYEILKARNSNATNKSILLKWNADTLTVSDIGTTMNIRTKPLPGRTLPMPGNNNGSLSSLLNTQS